VIALLKSAAITLIIGAKMSDSRLQEPFLREFRDNFRATHERMMSRIAETRDDQVDGIIEDELRGLYHGLLVIFDGGTALADEGLIQIVDDEGVVFDRFLHEICFRYWPAN
jgi:hypothetical protein